MDSLGWKTKTVEALEYREQEGGGGGGGGGRRRSDKSVKKRGVGKMSRRARTSAVKVYADDVGFWSQYLKKGRNEH